MELVIGAAFVGVIFLIWSVATFNRFAHLKNLVLESWADVDVSLQRRHDLIPNLVETVRGYAAHEAAVFERIARLREDAIHSRGDVAKLSENERELASSVNQMLVVAEAYPQLQSSRHFLALQEELASTEDRVAAARRFYNANVRELNTLLDSFPASFIGSSSGVRRAEFFEAESIHAPTLRQRLSVTANLAQPIDVSQSHHSS